MNKVLHIIVLIALCACLGFSKAWAQNISVSVPSHVRAGENFRLSYTVSTQDIDDFRAGNIPAGLEVLAGPYTSQQSSYQIVNGHTSSSSTITFTYTLYAAKNGTYIIPAAHAYIGGRHLASHAAKITVSGHARSNNGQPQVHEPDQPQMRSAGSRISGNDLFIRVSANKKRVHEQEPVLLTYKVYTLVDLTRLEGKMPDLTGFHTQEVQLPQQKSFHVESVNGKNYRCVTWSQYVMYPQMTGKLAIPSITFKGIVVQQNRSVDPLEAWLNGGSNYTEINKNIIAPGITIQVDPLPKRPAGFSGGVGKFNISAQLNKSEVKAGEPLQLRVVVGGIGNLKLIKQPVVQFPKDFEKYDAKITDKTKLTSNGVEGNMIYDFLAVPQNQGHYTIPSVEFTYYDTGSNSYKTIRTRKFDINVAKGDGKSGSIEDYQKDNDIHGILTGDAEQHDINDFFFGSSAYMISLLLPLGFFVALLIIFRKRAMDMADVVKMRGKKANKIATKRLRKANKLMLTGKQNEFYDEVLRALWGYVGDKLNMPVERLSKENIADNLKSHNVDDETVNRFQSALDECEFERYAPGDAAGNMNKTFESAMTAIMEIENAMKHKTGNKNGKTLVFVILALFAFSLNANAVTKKNADDEYKKGNYQQAINDYEELLSTGVNAKLYYNLGNAYYRTDNITGAVLNYERALMLEPGNSDIRFNLQFARSKTIDKISGENEMFFVTWYKTIVNYTSVDNWAITAIVSIIVALLLLLVYLFVSNVNLRKIGFFGSAICIVIFLLSNLFALQQKYQFINRTGAVVIAPTVNVKKTPAKSSSDEFVIHEGTRVDITDKGMKQWRGVKLADGREGWVLTKQIEEI
jgi:tetratricopeptide (TPR) repeat protein